MTKRYVPTFELWHSRPVPDARQRRKLVVGFFFLFSKPHTLPVHPTATGNQLTPSSRVASNCVFIFLLNNHRALFRVACTSPAAGFSLCESRYRSKALELKFVSPKEQNVGMTLGRRARALIYSSTGIGSDLSLAQTFLRGRLHDAAKLDPLG